MKYLVLALCVCTASAASPYSRPSPYGNVPKVAKVAASPVVAAAKVAASPFVAVANAVVNAPAPVEPAVVNIPGSAPLSAQAKTAYSDAEAEVINNDVHINNDGSYHAQVETNNGIYSESTGTLKEVGDAKTLVVSGSYKYYAQDGTPIVITYTADENGYHPEGDSIPTAPPVPQEILDSIAYNAKYAPANEEKTY